MRRTLLVAVLALAVAALSVHATSPTVRAVGDSCVEVGGSIFRLSGSGWVPVSGLPVSGADVLFVIGDPGAEPGALITLSGDGWLKQDVVGWTNFGPAPGSPVPAQRATWGEVKARYR